MKIIRSLCFSLMLGVFIPMNASAQTPLINENAQASERMDRLEHDLMLLQKQVGSIFIAEVGRLGEFLEFLEIKERFGT